MRARTGLRVVTRSRRPASIAGAVVVVVAMSSGTPAHAVQEQTYTNCGSDLDLATISWDPTDYGRISFDRTQCPTLSLSLGTSATPEPSSTEVSISGAIFKRGSISSSNLTVISVFDEADYIARGATNTPPPVGTYVVYYKYNSSPTPYLGSFTVIVGTPASSSPPASSPSAGDSTPGAAPAPLLQEFGVPATGTCDEAQPEGLNWGGVASGGWSTVWGEWMHDGLGGWACSRTLSYSSALAKWVVD